jgi:hypothetical protein
VATGCGAGAATAAANVGGTSMGGRASVCAQRNWSFKVLISARRLSVSVVAAAAAVAGLSVFVREGMVVPSVFPMGFPLGFKEEVWVFPLTEFFDLGRSAEF